MRTFLRGIIFLSIIIQGFLLSDLRSQCTYSIGLYDTYGDGWNGGSVTVYVNGSPVLSGVTLSSGYGPVWYNFTVAQGQSITVTYSAGSYSSENYFVVKNGASGSGSTIYSTPTYTTPASSHVVTNSCTSGGSGGGGGSGCTYSIGLYDTYGDGWNGGSVTVYVNGSPVLSGVTLSSGYGPVWYNFTVTQGQTITITYSAGSYSYENYFIVKDGPSGTGTTIYSTPSGSAPASSHTVTNSCAISSCSTLPTAPTASGATITCGNTATLSASGSTGNYVWYASSTGGTPLGTGSTYTTSVLGGTTTYYVGASSSPVSTSCTYSICVYDTYGDGWHGNNFVNVYVNGVNVVSNATVISGYGPYCYNFTVSPGQTIQVTYSSGSYPSECYYRVYGGAGGSGALIYASTQGSTPPSSQAVTNLCSSGSSCISLLTPVTVTVNNLAGPTVSGSTSVTCGSTATLTASGGSSYAWYTTSTGGSPVSTSATFTTPALTSNTTYYVESQTSSGGVVCTSSRTPVTISVTTPTAPTITPSGSTTFCQGGSVTLNASGGPNHIWSNGATGSSIVVTSPGNYTVQSVAGTCTSAVSNTITVNTHPVPTAPTITAMGPTSFCQGGSVVLNSNAASGITWSGGAGTGTTATITTSGTYTATYTDNNGCTSNPSNAISVTVYATPPAPSISPSGTVPICQGNAVTLTANQGSGISWNTGASGSSLSVSSAGSYTAIYTDGNGCVSPASAPVNVVVNSLPAAPVITPGGPTTFCFGNSVTLNSNYPSGNTWSTGSSSASINVSQTGTYTATYTDANGCTSTSSTPVNVTVHPLPIPPTITASGPTSFCQGGSVLLMSDYSTGLTWSGGLGNSQTVSVTASGTYTVTHTNANGCTSNPSNAISVTVFPTPPAPIITPSGTVSVCQGSTIQLTADQSSGVIWNNGANTQAIQVGTVGSYAATYTDANGCLSPQSTPVNVVVNQLPAAPVITPSGPTTFCDGNSVTLVSSYGTGNLWSTGDATANIIVTQSGTYTVAHTDTNGCTSSASVPVTVTVHALPPSPVISAQSNTSFCTGDSVLLTSNYVQGNTWNTGATSQGIYASIQNAYTATYTDGNGCTSLPSAPVQVQVNPNPVASLVTAATVCEGQTTSLQATASVNAVNGASVSQYYWYFGDGNQQVAGVSASHQYLAAGQYNVKVVVETNHGCLDSTTSIAVVNPKPSIQSVLTPAACEGNATSFSQTSVVSAVNGASIAQFDWDFGDGTLAQGSSTSHLYAVPGSYSGNLIVTTNHGCADTMSWQTDVNPKPVISSIQTAPVCEGEQVLLAQTSNVNAINGAQISVYQWDLGDGNTGSGTQLSHLYATPGTYNVQLIVGTNHGCTDTLTSPATVNPSPVITALPVSAVCDGMVNQLSQQSQVSNVNGGQLIQYEWDLGDGTQSSLPTVSHQYSAVGSYPVRLVVHSNHGCTDTAYTTALVNPNPVISSINAPVICEGAGLLFNQHSQVSGDNGAVISGYFWDFGDGNTDVAAQPVHNYAAPGNFNVQLVVSTSHGCADTASVTAVVNPQPVISQMTVPAVCENQANVFSQVSQVANVNNAAIVQYIWDLGDGTQASLPSLTHNYAVPGAYPVQLIVQTNHGCWDMMQDTAFFHANPQIVALYGATVCEGTPIQFQQNSTVSAVNGAVLQSWNWDFGDGSTGSQTQHIHIYSQPGTYTVQLVAQTNFGCTDTAWAQAIVHPRPQISQFSAPDMCEGNPVPMSAQFTVQPVNGAALQYTEWTLGDGSVVLGTDNLMHVYPQSGAYPVQLVVQTNHGCADTVIQQVMVHANPVITLVDGGTVCEGQVSPLQVQASVSSVNNAVIAQYVWDFGDGQNGSGANPAHTYAQYGNYPLSVVASTQYGCLDSLSGMAVVYAAPAADFMAPDVCFGNEIQFSNLSAIAQGQIQQYSWSFGDFGGNSSMETPSYFYTQPGSYNVQLAVVSDMGCTDTIIHAVNILPGPDANFSAQLVSPFTVKFIPNVMDAQYSYLWIFGDGTTSNAMTPVKSFAQPGMYFVCLQVSSPECSAEHCTDFQLNTTGISGVNDNSVQVQIYPNPSSDHAILYLKLPKPEPVTYSISDMAGRLLFDPETVENANSELQISLDHRVKQLPAGAYFIRLQTRSGSYVLQWIKSPEQD